MLNKNIFKNSAGFSLMEVILAIFIVIIGFFAALTLINRSLIAGAQSASRLVAANLAQEGIEVVKNIRELNYNQATAWDTWYANIADGTYSVQYNSANFGSSYDNFLYFHSSSGLYDYSSSGGTLSPYKRSITLTKMSAVEIKVVATVTWTYHHIPQSMVVEDRIWNWR